MKKALKITGIVLGLTLLSGVIITAGISYASKWLGFRKDVENPIYGPGKKCFYLATAKKANGEMLYRDTIILQIYDERFLLLQNKITWKVFKPGNVKKTEYTGIIENEKALWIHPPRFKGYVEFTEFAPFPEVRLPVKINKTWDGKLILGGFQTKESGPTVTKNYVVQQIDSIPNEIGNYLAFIKSTGVSGLGEYSHNFIFDSRKGFIKMDYKKANGETLDINLIDSEVDKP